MGKLSKNFRNKSFKQMKLERKEKSEATARLNSFKQGSNGRATVSAQNQARPIVSNRSAQAAEHIAGAFENAMSAPREKRGQVLLHKLHLKPGNRRPKDLDWYEIGQHVHNLVQKGLSQFDAAAQTCVDLQDSVDVKLSESTVLRLWRDVYRPAREAHDKAFQD